MDARFEFDLVSGRFRGCQLDSPEVELICIKIEVQAAKSEVELRVFFGEHFDYL